MEVSAEAVVSAEPGAAVVLPVSAVDSMRRLIPGELNRCSPTAGKKERELQLRSKYGRNPYTKFI